MFIEKFFKYFMAKNNSFKLKFAALIILLQSIVFFIAFKYHIGSSTYLSLILIVCFAFAMGELSGLFFAAIVAACFSPLWINLEAYGFSWWVIRAFGFAFAAIVIGGLSEALRKHLDFEEKIRLIDTSTGFPNKQAICEKLAELSKSQASGHFSLVIITISNIKMLSETFGSDVFKSVFEQFKDRYSELVKNYYQEIEAYVLSHEQIVFFFRKDDTDDLEAKNNFEDRLVSTAKKNFLHKGFFIHCDSHIGIYRFPNFSGINSEDKPLHYAEEAVDTATKQMKDLVVYGPSNFAQKSKSSKNFNILSDIDLAIRSRWMYLVYQPKIDLATGKISSVEALIRWNHPVHGFVPPDQFIPQAEQSTLIENITDFVIKQAILQLKLWQRSGIYVHIAVNVSIHNLMQPNFVNKVLNMLQEKDLPSECLEIEVTEGALISDFQHILEGLNRFHDAKIRIALDDFGTGYSSFQYLQRMPISYLKIDQSFVRNLGANRESKEIVKAIVDLAHTIDVKTIAEGIETISDYEYLNNINCDIGQGFYMSKPLTSNTFVSWYSENNGVFKPV